MYHVTFQRLTHLTDDVEFERMMCDLLGSLGYRGIDPQSPGLPDGGKDALYYNQIDKVWFAFSLNKRWKGKFKEDFAKAKGSGRIFTKFVFCSNQSLPALERDKIKNENRDVEIEFYDCERIRVLLDTEYKKIRQIYLGIFDNTTIRRKIINTLYDAENEVDLPERWRAIGMIASPEMIGLFELTKNEDLSEICETQEEYNLLIRFVREYLVLRKVSTEIDNYIFEVVSKNVGENGFIRYWNKMCEYCKLRLFGLDLKQAEGRVRTWNISSISNEEERFYSLFTNDDEIQQMKHRIGISQQRCTEIMREIQELKGFQMV